MRFTITSYDDHGTPAAAQTVDLTTLKTLLAEAATTGRRLHIRPQPREDGHSAPAQEPR
ncbi:MULTISPECIES: hypothetical protein [Streptomycetaceae]|uniref:hypothetical protein n=1 Tax=Streptomycetaceae TaxID=2062 RepID=UPI001661E3A2|nr:hypothetical protein [Streptomyces sp. CBMA123]